MKHLPHTFARIVLEENNRVFKPTFFGLFAITGGGIAFLVTAMGLILWATNPTVPLSVWVAQLLPLFLIGVLGEIPITLWMRHHLRVEVGTEAIHATTHGNTRHSLTWSEIEGVELHRAFGLAAWKIRSFRKDLRPLYIPLAIANDEAFRQKVIETTSPINPLRRALESGIGKAIPVKANA